MKPKENYKHLAYNTTADGASLPLGSFFGSVEAHRKPEGNIVRRFVGWVCDVAIHQYATQPEQPASVAVSQSVEVQQVQ